MAFDKRDYLYDNSEYGPDDEEVQGKEKSINIGETQTFRDRVPREWVQGLMFKLQNAAHSKGVELLNTCTSLSLANFAGKYNKDVWRY